MPAPIVTFQEYAEYLIMSILFCQEHLCFSQNNNRKNDNIHIFFYIYIFLMPFSFFE